MKRTKEYTIPDVVHRYGVRIVFGNQEGFKNILKDKDYCDLDVDIDSEYKRGTKAMTFFTHGDCIILMFENEPTTLLHELQHCIMMQANRIGYRPDDGQERFCYTLEYLISELIKSKVFLCMLDIKKPRKPKDLSNIKQG